jgi:hypothetical protein
VGGKIPKMFWNVWKDSNKWLAMYWKNHFWMANPPPKKKKKSLQPSALPSVLTEYNPMTYRVTCYCVWMTWIAVSPNHVS